MARPRKIMKRVSIEVQVDMSASDFKDFKANVKDLVQCNFASNFNGTLTYLAIGAEDRE